MDVAVEEVVRCGVSRSCPVPRDGSPGQTIGWAQRRGRSLILRRAATARTRMGTGPLVERSDPSRSPCPRPEVPLLSQSVTPRAALTLTRQVSVAAGVFAPAHLGELTRYLPFELVDDVLTQTRTMQRRLRLLPSRAGVYFVLALALFPDIGYLRVWDKLRAGLTRLSGPVRPDTVDRSDTARAPAAPQVSEKALRNLRWRLGPAPLKMLFELVAGPLGQPRTPGVSYAGMRTVAFDGLNSIKIPDSDRNRAWLGRIYYRLAFAGYPTARLLCLVETGTRGLLGAVIGGAVGVAGDRDESHLARRLLTLLGPGMLLLADRAYDSASLLAEIDNTGAKVLLRAGSARKPHVTAILTDGSYLSVLGGVPVRIIEAQLTMTGADGTLVSEPYRLITTLRDTRRHPADALLRLYHERWEIETAFLALRHTLLGGHVLRSHDRPGVEQEIWALLTLYQLLRTAIVDAIETRPGLDPDRASFTTALQSARDQLHLVLPADDVLVGAIGRAVLATLLPARRARYSNRNVKCPSSRYHARNDGRPQNSTSITSIDIAVHAPPPSDPNQAPPRQRLRPRFAHQPPAAPRAPVPPTRRDRVVAILTCYPARSRRGSELADALGVPRHNILAQLSEWARLGFLQRTGPGLYALPGDNTPSASLSTRSIR